uniref:Uncharacterized protein n=1 Tax=Ditylenchus dipsaci TaxID=166011 RepID=A0A915DV71_9BILA
MESDSDSDVNVFGDSSEEEVSATIRASSERIPTKVVNDAVVRFVCGKRKSQYSLIYEGSYKLYQVAVADNCRRAQPPREPMKMGVLFIVDKALRIVNQNPLTMSRDIIAAALEGAIDEVRFAVNTKSLGHRLTLFKQNLFPRGSFAPADLIIPEGWSVHTDGSQFIFFDSGSASRFVVMSSLFMLEKLSQCTSIACDGHSMQGPEDGASFMSSIQDAKIRSS